MPITPRVDRLFRPRVRARVEPAEAPRQFDPSAPPRGRLPGRGPQDDAGVRMSPRRILRALTALSAISASTFVMQSGTARADDASDLEGLLDESVVTTASKSAETATTAPATSTTITAED